jgi:hypothetical protein
MTLAHHGEVIARGGEVPLDDARLRLLCLEPIDQRFGEAADERNLALGVQASLRCRCAGIGLPNQRRAAEARPRGETAARGARAADPTTSRKVHTPGDVSGGK